MSENITVQVIGGQPKVIQADTVQEAYDALELDGNYTATVNGNPSDMDDDLNDYAFVSFSEKVKGGAL